MRPAAVALAAALASVVTPGCAHDPRRPPLPEEPVALRIKLSEGKILTLGSLRGRVVLLTVMTTWADTAIIEVPRLRRIASETKAQVVAVALDREADAVAVFGETFKLNYPLGTIDDPDVFTGAAGPFGPIELLPTSFLIDADGHVVARMDGVWPPRVLEEAIDRLLASGPSSR